jgi:hypothetical protein
MHEKLDGAMHQTSPRAARHSVEDIDEASPVPAGAVCHRAVGDDKGAGWRMRVSRPQRTKRQPRS